MEYDIGYMEQQLFEKDEKIETAKKIINDLLTLLDNECYRVRCYPEMERAVKFVKGE